MYFKYSKEKIINVRDDSNKHENKTHKQTNKKPVILLYQNEQTNHAWMMVGIPPPPPTSF